MVKSNAEKCCSKCNLIKEVSCFHKDKVSKDGYRGVCKKCRKRYEKRYDRKDSDKKYREKNRERLKKYHKKYRDKNAECLKRKNKEAYIDNKNNVNFINKRKEYRDNNKDKKAKYDKKYRDQNKNRIREHRKEWRKNNIDKIKKYRTDNKEKISKQHNLYIYDKYHNDINYRISHSIRNRIGAAISDYSKRNGILRRKKRHPSLIYLGCSIEELIIHLENKFTIGMTWNNYGKWHIDHIKPLSSFNLHNEDDIKVACYYTNLQPLWAKDNIAKGAKYVY